MSLSTNLDACSHYRMIYLQNYGAIVVYANHNQAAAAFIITDIFLFSNILIFQDIFMSLNGRWKNNMEWLSINLKVRDQCQCSVKLIGV